MGRMDDGHDHDHAHEHPQEAPMAPPTEDIFDIIDGDMEIDLVALVANNTSPPTENQLLNILSSKLEGFVNPDGILDTSQLLPELP